MESLSALLSLCKENHGLPVVSLQKANNSEFLYFFCYWPEVYKLLNTAISRCFDASCNSYCLDIAIYFSCAAS